MDLLKPFLLNNGSSGSIALKANNGKYISVVGRKIECSKDTKDSETEFIIENTARNIVTLKSAKNGKYLCFIDHVKIDQIDQIEARRMRFADEACEFIVIKHREKLIFRHKMSLRYLKNVVIDGNHYIKAVESERDNDCKFVVEKGYEVNARIILYLLFSTL